MDKIYNGLQYFFAKRYTPTVASDYLRTGSLIHTDSGWGFVLPDTGRVYYFDKNLNFINLTDV